MATILSPVKDFDGKSAFGPLEVEFKKGVAETDKQLGPSLIAYLEKRGYVVEGNGKTNAEKEREATPGETWKVDELTAYAKENGIDLGKANKKADILEVILKGDVPPGDTPKDTPPAE